MTNDQVATLRSGLNALQLPRTDRSWPLAYRELIVRAEFHEPGPIETDRDQKLECRDQELVVVH